MPPNRIKSLVVFWLVIASLIGWLGWCLISGKPQQFDERVLTAIIPSLSHELNTEFSPTPTQALIQKLDHDSVASTTSSDMMPAPFLRRPEATSSAQVKRVIDGDTIELADGQVVRYIGVDTPETKHPNKAVECFGKEAAAQNEVLVSGKTVILEQDVSTTDRYGRLLRYVWVDGQLINWQLVRDGFAFAKSYPPDIGYQSSFNLAQQSAREQQRGLWSSCSQ